MYKFSEHALRWWKQLQSNRIRQDKEKICSWPKMKKMLAINFYLVDCDEILSYAIQDYYWPRSSYLNYFGEPDIPPLKEELHVEENIILKDYLEAKEQNIEIFEEINEGIVMEEDHKIKIIVEENNEDPIIEKDLKVKMLETIEEEIEVEIIKEFNKSKSNDYQYQNPFILVVIDTKVKLILLWLMDLIQLEVLIW